MAEAVNTNNTLQNEGNQDVLLQVKNLKKYYPIQKGMFSKAKAFVKAVDDVSFDIKRGETMGLVGESGCGKSTLGKAVLRLSPVTGGQVFLEGQEISTLSQRRLRPLRPLMQMVFQDPHGSLNPRHRVGRIIGQPLSVAGWSRADIGARVRELLVQVGLPPGAAERFPHEFSGGQRQRISIARALALDPKFIVADEAVSALDVSVKAQVSNLLLDLQQKHGLAYLFISHDMAVVERMSHRVAVMFLGEIVEIGPRAAIFDNPQHPYTKKLMAAVPVPDPARRNLKRNISTDEIKSPIRPVGYVPPRRSYREVSAGHLVQV